MSLSGIFPIDKWSFTTQSILSILSDEEYSFLIGRQGEQRYHKGEIVFREGVVPYGIFFIHQGKVKKYKVDPSGREQIIYVANNGELIGYHAVLSEERYPDFAAAMEESVISFIPKDDFLTVLNNSPIFANRLLKSLSHEYSVLANNISVFAQRTAIERLSIALIVMREKFKIETPPGKEIIIEISRNDLANIAGIAKENVIRLLKELKSESIIQTEGRKIWVTDLEKLIARSNYK
ncbi:Crp/Fnr family transcriptional regulator [Pedobacter suwonensis]|uniref:Crp/Fnr family transcriptional regulator n=1 Tax=Pedobacter suwonensis TaxID=332999 RepID=UPI0036914666